MESPDIRWEQRFNNFERAFAQLERGMQQSVYNDLEKEGMIQRFEYTYELAWKTLQDYAEYLGFNDVKGPKIALAKALELGIIEDASGWNDLHRYRNMSAHTYDGQTADAILFNIKSRFFVLFQALILKLRILKI